MRLHTTGNHDVCKAQCNLSCSMVDGGNGRATLHLDVMALRLNGETCAERGITSGVKGLDITLCAATNDTVNLCLFQHLGLIKKSLDNQRSDVGGAKVFETATLSSENRARAVYKYYFTHTSISFLYHICRFFRRLAATNPADPVSESDTINKIPRSVPRVKENRTFSMIFVCLQQRIFT